MTKLNKLCVEARRLADESEWKYTALPGDFFSNFRIGGRFETDPTVYHFTHVPCVVVPCYHEAVPPAMSTRTVACVMPSGPDNVLYHRAGECPRIDYESL